MLSTQRAGTDLAHREAEKCIPMGCKIIRYGVIVVKLGFVVSFVWAAGRFIGIYRDCC
jgi:hypothetical protein